MALPDFVNEIDILEYISQYVEFEERDGEFWALSMFNSENTPSFSIRKETNQFYDFSAGFGGGLLVWVRRYHKCDTGKAVEILHKYAREKGISNQSSQSPRMEAVKIAKKFSPHKKQKKVSKSVVLPDDYMLRFEKNESALALWEAEGISREVLEKFQVRFDSLAERIVYPIRNLEGKIINVSGRTTDGRYKEKGLRKYTYYFPLGVLDTIYGLAENYKSIMDSKQVVVFEGAKSVMIRQSWGKDNSVALLTSHLNPYQMKILAKLGCKVVFALDKGVDIKEDINIRKLKRFVEVSYTFDMANRLNDKDSPVDKGIEVWRTLCGGRLRYK